MSQGSVNAVRQSAVRWVALGSALLIGAAATLFTVPASAGGHHGHGGWGHHGSAAMHEHGAGGAKFKHHRHDGRKGERGDAQLRQFDRLLGDAKLSETQRKQIQDIRVKTRADLKALAPVPAERAARPTALFAQEKLDVAAAERQRQARLAHQDQFSKRLLQEQVDVAKVLTPVQRAKIGTELKAREEARDKRMQERLKERAARKSAASASAPQ